MSRGGSAGDPVVDRLVVVGVGLIGGSCALALKDAGAVREVVGVGRSRANLDAALARGIADRVHALDGRWTDELARADVVLVATPVGEFGPLFERIAAHAGPATIVTDAGSTKRDVVDAVHRHFGTVLPDVVPAHPIAGAEKSGVEAAFAELYIGRKVVLTPLPESRPDAVQKVRDAWEACGAVVVGMTPQEHDRVFAAVSHLPHLLAFGLVDDLAGRSNAPLLFSHAASGFRDFTRIAGSHPEMWRDICVANRVALLEELDAYLGELARLRTMLVEADGDGLEAVFERARRARNAWAEGLPVRTAE